MKKPIVLIILDGWGYREDKTDNAIAMAKKPFFDHLWNTYPHSLLKASGEAVGLPPGQMGNSEVGHMTIGAGKPADTDLVRIDKAIALGEFYTNPALLSLFKHVKMNNSVLHVQGLVSPGGVHSHQNHLYAFLNLARKNNVPRVAIHVFTDGRDTAPQSASVYIEELESVLDILNSDKNKPNFFIATLSGRYYSMDRDNNWDRLARTEQAMFECKGNVCKIKPSEYLSLQYKKGERDELLPPTVCTTPEGMGCAIKDGDAVFFFNFRADRARMLSEKMLAVPKDKNILFVTLTEYCVDFVCITAFPPFKIETSLGQEIEKAHLSQARIAETEKFAHATYFLNGGNEKKFEKETDIMLQSRKDIKTHDEAPEMRAEGIADAVIEEVKKKTDFVFVNFANPDMVGHSANVKAIITAIETVDTQLKRVVEAIETSGGIALITSDHGNAEINIDPITKTKHTAHTTSPVPFILTSHDYKVRDGALFDLAPTVLDLLGVKKAESMIGKTLIK